MAWDSNRPIPWKRLMREWIVYVSIMIIVFAAWTIIKGDSLKIATFAGLLASGPLYVAFGAILAKFGYQRKTLKDLRAIPREPRPSRNRGGEESNVTHRHRPAPTSRTTTGPSQHRPTNKRKRR